ncbi:2-oxoglutarate dehydrogenase E1 component [Planctomycetota bacterium]
MENIGYLEDLYREWEDNPAAVSGDWAAFFRQQEKAQEDTRPAVVPSGKMDMAYRQSRVDSMLWAYRDIGYLYAQLNPLGGDYGPDHTYIHNEDRTRYEQLTLKQFGIGETDLDTVFSAGRAIQPNRAPLRDIINAFRETYCGSVGVEFLHIQDKAIRRWLIEKMESCRNQMSLSKDQKRIILHDLLRTESLEHGLHSFFVGQKRFSLQGSEAIILGLHYLVDSAPKHGIEDMVIGTTHRGRLSILNTVLHMTPEEIFSTFDENIKPRLYGGTGDVKYHIGYETDHVHEDGSVVHVGLCANSSHLESIDAVVQGKARALQDMKHARNRRKVLPITLHGDAAFSGQGVVAETLNLSRLEGYTTGGTIHIIINNQIGFTTSARQARSSLFPTDMAKALPVPIFHINGDDPEAFVYAADLALQFRQEFGTDCVLDVFCFRRYGHNESDEPSFTHPYMYRLIKDHPGVATLYGRLCAAQGVADREEQQSIRRAYDQALKEALQRSRSQSVALVNTSQGADWERIRTEYAHEPGDTAVESSVIKRVAHHVTEVPENFHVHRTLYRILTRKREAFDKQGEVDWPLAETLAFGTLLLEGVPVRLSGEDCSRGTFSQRHLTWWDTKSEKPRPYTPLSELDPDQALLSTYDSPLSEYSVLGFEYGYSLVDPHALTIWEAQFGDFANGAQVIIDNYLASAHAKWDRSSGLVLLLPHGNEGQGPDHSSGHLARFLQLCARDNLQVVNLTTAAQYFHVLRRQVKVSFRRPLVVMSPKSLLRHPHVASPVTELIEGRFAEAIDDTIVPDKVQRILLCSGKIYYDLLAQREKEEKQNMAIVRVEQLFPFPEDALEECLTRYPQAQSYYWVQEEPQNYGAWVCMHMWFHAHFPQIELQYVGRPECPSSATGSSRHHKAEQQQLVEQAFADAPVPLAARLSTNNGENS